jgi:hypothetical protein
MRVSIIDIFGQVGQSEVLSAEVQRRPVSAGFAVLCV